MGLIDLIENCVNNNSNDGYGANAINTNVNKDSAENSKKIVFVKF